MVLPFDDTNGLEFELGDIMLENEDDDDLGTGDLVGVAEGSGDGRLGVPLGLAFFFDVDTGWG